MGLITLHEGQLQKPSEGQKVTWELLLPDIFGISGMLPSNSARHRGTWVLLENLRARLIEPTELEIQGQDA